MKRSNFMKTWFLMVLAISCAHADINRIYFESGEEINKTYQDNPQNLEQNGASAQRQRLKKYQQSILDSKNLPVDQAIEILEKNLIHVAYSFQVAERIEVYDQLQAALLAIPGYSDYYMDRIEQSRVKAKAPGAENRDITDYEDKRSSAFEVMRNLPGPESIKFLGHYLYDDRDPAPPMTKDQDWFSPVASSESSSNVINGIGLRNPPTDESDASYWHVPENMTLNKAWWEKVKAGQIPFSFKRQTVEYRFRPDGTWETTQLPISVLERDKNPAAPAQAPSTVRAEKRGLPESGATDIAKVDQPTSTARRYILPLLGFLVLLLVAGYFIRRQKVT